MIDTLTLATERLFISGTKLLGNYHVRGRFFDSQSLIPGSDPRPFCCSRSEVNIYIQVPQGVGSKDLAVNIASRHVSVGIKGNPPYLSVSFCGFKENLNYGSF